MRRRTVLSGALAGAAGTLLWAPGLGAKQNRGHDAYFSRLNTLLKNAGPGRPVMLIDVDRMNGNIDRIADSVGPDKTYRVVVKSLPSVPLLQHVAARSNTRALMVFHQPFLNAVAAAMPDSDVLLGKPMPVAAARTFYNQLGRGRFDPAVQLQWLIDTRERLLQYGALARELGVKMRVNLEIDVGLHRGGFAEPEALGQALDVAQADPGHLTIIGLMGYEPHLTGLEASLEHPEVQKVLKLYEGHVARLRGRGLAPENMTLNGAGSHTLKIYERDRTMNDLSAGSGVVKPTDFDTFHLNDHLPALFIATPILKRYDVNPLDPATRLYYIYGGYWKARLTSPVEVGKPIYQSTNQSPIVTANDVALGVDDYMFMRPTQSEFVMLQFGDLLPVKDGEIVGRWPVFHQTG